ncbi:MAG: histidinol-phosphatase HisJ family protein [Spirochaetes bacterium]|nr:histidinol-phosphatase HisJ family protein [Spirochaetota bacterium]MBN2769530.1 histidinol-phosphatase HisJ family protein [Spirochaetota bacterium]
MNKYDYHIHGTFSSDSTAAYGDLIQKAINENYKQIAFTDHFDFLPSEALEYGVPSYTEYVKHIENLQTKFKSSMSILLGVEIGEFHRVTPYTDRLFKIRKPDLTIGSIHVLTDGFNVSVPFNEIMTKNQVLDYYNENLALCEQSPINILGHLGIHKRYYTQTPDESYVDSLIDKILETLIKREIALEINYSPFRKTYNSFLPEIPVLKRYLNKGGKLVTIGSDSHSVENFDDNYNHTAKILSDCGCKELAIISPNGWTTTPLSCF